MFDTALTFERTPQTDADFLLDVVGIDTQVCGTSLSDDGSKSVPELSQKFVETTRQRIVWSVAHGCGRDRPFAPAGPA